MTTTAEHLLHALRTPTVAMLRELGISTHRLGYRYLTVAIPCYAADDTQSLTKELYPYVAHCFGHTDWHSIERSIRTVILAAWEQRDPVTWARYFPNQSKAPSNKQFIATLAEQLK